MEDRRIDVVLLMILVLIIWMLAVLSLGADEPPVVFNKDKQGWTVPPGFVKYKQTKYSQRIVEYVQSRAFNGPSIISWHRDKDDGRSKNPNRLHPYAVPAGLDDATGWTSETYYSLPEGVKIKAWTSRVPIAMGGLLPKRQWRFPDGTKFAEVLSVDGEVFEVRERVRVQGKFVSSVPFRSPASFPRGYTGKLAKSCADCHKSAGASEQYGITVRGDDGVFSFPVLREGSTEWRDDLPLDLDASAVERDSATTGLPGQSFGNVPGRLFLIRRRGRS